MSNYVYLDHLIEREPFLYKSAQDFETTEADSTPRASLLMMDNPNSKQHGGFRAQLRKPDFQRATWAWTPEQCVILLDSLLKYRVVPSVILWLSPDNFIYVLDGGHRMSVLLAYMEDDWGDKGLQHLPLAQIEATRRIADEVRRLMTQRQLASFKDHQDANATYWRLSEQENGDKAAIKSQMNPREWELALRYRGWVPKDIGFSIQWVNGTYTDAEESFVRINSSGTNLSDWEIKLVRYRQSSFARLVTSIAHPEFTDRCWPRRNEMGELLTAQEQSAVTEILEQSELISSLLWEPRGVPNGNRLRPLLVPSLSEPASTPLYVGELLTVVQGEGGRTSQTEELMRRDLTGDSETLLSNGRSLAQKTLAALHHLRGKTVLSMGIVSSAYFYNADGIAIRSLFYGFLYWINYGAKDEILLRKRIFSAHRDGFEKAYLLKKKEVITRISRKSGSGGEVTLQTARYFNGLLQLVVDFVGRIDTPDFDKAHQQLLIDIRKAGSSTSSYTEENLGNSADVALRSRVATRTQRAHLQLASELEMMPRCEICGGRMLMDDLLSPPHIDHKKEHSEGGATSVTNLRPTHPFCNHQRREIESLKVGRSALPSFVDSKGQSLTFQLDFLTLWDEEKEEEEDEEFTPDISEDVTRESGLETTPSLFGEN